MADRNEYQGVVRELDLDTNRVVFENRSFPIAHTFLLKIMAHVAIGDKILVELRDDVIINYVNRNPVKYG